MQSEGYYLEEEGGKKTGSNVGEVAFRRVFKKKFQREQRRRKEREGEEGKRRFLGARGGNLVGKSSKS